MLFFALIFFVGISSGQSNTLELIVRNHSGDPVVLGKLRGDRFIPVDTTSVLSPAASGAVVRGGKGSGKGEAASLFRFHLPASATPGVYRLILGYSTYARVTGGDPQYLDILYRGEDVMLATDFKAPVDSLDVILSEENQAWFLFLRQEKAYREPLILLEQEVDYYQSRAGSLADAGARLASVANQFNQLQMERDLAITAFSQKHSHRLAGALAALFREPLRDGYLTPAERRQVYHRDYFQHVDFTNPDLLNGPYLTDKIFRYLVSYNRRELDQSGREAAYIRAVDAVMERVGAATAVAAEGSSIYEFILNYLVDGFEKLQMDAVLDHIAAAYRERICTTDDKSTLERRLAAQQMKPGMVLPDFTLPDADGEPVTLSGAAGARNLILFWSADCPHCLEMLPRIAQWQRQLPAGSLEIFAISLDVSPEVWLEAVRKAGFEFYHNLCDLKAWNGTAAQDYNVYATPTLFLMDRERRLVAKPLSLEEVKNNF